MRSQEILRVVNSVNSVKIDVKMNPMEEEINKGGQDGDVTNHQGQNNRKNRRNSMLPLPNFQTAFGNMGGQFCASELKRGHGLSQQTGRGRGSNNRGAHHQGLTRNSLTKLKLGEAPGLSLSQGDVPLIQMKSAETETVERTDIIQTAAETSGIPGHETVVVNPERKRERVESRTDEEKLNKTPKIPKVDEKSLGTMLKENAMVLMQIEKKMTELGDSSKSMEAKLQKMENDRERDLELINSLHEACGDNRASINFLHEMIVDSNGLITKNDKCMEEKLVSINENHTNLVETVQKIAKDHRQQEQQISKLNEFKEASARVLDERGLEVTPVPDFSVNKTLVATGIKYDVNEDLTSLAKTIIHETLNLPHVKIIRTKRMSTWRNGKGLIKIELGCNQDVVDVVANKQKLSRSSEPDIQTIFLRQSKMSQTLANERNQDLILKLIGRHRDYRRKQDGTLVARDGWRLGGSVRRFSDTEYSDGHNRPRTRSMYDDRHNSVDGYY